MITDLCALCSHYASEDHHILYRSRGGGNESDNLLPLCRTCHDALHREELRISLEALADGRLTVHSVQSGEVLVDRAYPDYAESLAMTYISHATRDLESVAQFGLEALPLEALGQIIQQVESLLDAWPLRAEAIYRAYNGWLLWDEAKLITGKLTKLAKIAESFSISPDTARQEYDIAETFWPEDGKFAHMVFQKPARQFSVWRAAADKEEPFAAIERVQEMAGASPVGVRRMLAAMDNKEPRELYVQFPINGQGGEWYPLKGLAREYRETE